MRPSFEIASAFNEDGSDYPNQGTDVSYGINPITSFPVFFAEPTPGTPNDPAGVNQVGDTSFSVDRGIYCLLYTSPSPRDQRGSRMPSSA